MERGEEREEKVTRMHLIIWYEYKWKKSILLSLSVSFTDESGCCLRKREAKSQENTILACVSRQQVQNTNYLCVRMVANCLLDCSWSSMRVKVLLLKIYTSHTHLTHMYTYSRCNRTKWITYSRQQQIRLSPVNQVNHVAIISPLQYSSALTLSLQ